MPNSVITSTNLIVSQIDVFGLLALLSEGEIKEQICSLYRRLNVCEERFAISVDGCIADQLSALFIRLEIAELGLMKKLGATPQMIQVLERVQNAEKILRDRDLKFLNKEPATQEEIPKSTQIQKENTERDDLIGRQVIAPATPTHVDEPIHHKPSPKLRQIKQIITKSPVQEQSEATNEILDNQKTQKNNSVANSDPTYTIEQLKTGATFPDNIDPTQREKYLADSEFEQVLGLSRADYYALPRWKRDSKKKSVGLF